MKNNCVGRTLSSALLRASLSAACAVALLFSTPSVFAQEGQQQFADLGDFKLINGEVIRDCRIGYRTFGHLDAGKSNIVLSPTRFTGTTEQMRNMFGPGGAVDSTKYYIIAVDALGNGVSSSPSNSKPQPRMKFPKFTIADMVNSQHQLLTEVLHINHVKAVTGGSMGGMQTFQWMVSYPDFMDKAIPVVGSPRLAPYDLMLWQAENDAIRSDPKWNNGDYTEQPGTTLLGEIGALVYATPEKYNQDASQETLSESIAFGKKHAEGFDANNHIRQSEAMMAHDVSRQFGGSMEKAAAAVKAKVLVIVSATDHMVTPGPALDFARLLHAEVLELKNNCGHGGPGCEAQKVNRAVDSFLGR